MPIESVDQILDHAAELILERGWIQGEMEKPSGFCVVGAIKAVVGGDPPWSKTVMAARDALRVRIDSDSIVAWNDRKDRTKEEVINALRGAAIDYRMNRIEGKVEDA